MKKTKLFLSLCMMCLCVAVLCMGILAASSATYNINGNISYNMIDGVALVNTRVYKVAGTTSETDLSTQCTTLSTKSFEEIERDTSTYYILSQKLDSQPLINTSSGETYSSTTTSVDIKYGAVDSVVEYYTYYVVIAIKNVSTDTSYVLNAYLSELGTSTISNIASNANGESSKIKIESGEFYNIVIGLSYNGGTISDTNETFTCTLTVECNKFNWLNLSGSFDWTDRDDNTGTWDVDMNIRVVYGAKWGEMIAYNKDTLYYNETLGAVVLDDYHKCTYYKSHYGFYLCLAIKQDGSLASSDLIVVSSAVYTLEKATYGAKEGGFSGGDIV